MLGLTGDLGRSLAEFIISRGARHVILSSRTPKPDEKWTERQQNIYEATVIFIAVSVVKMTIEQLQGVLRPKIDGSLHPESLLD
ncbi:hypothetical protein ACHAP5_011984, partial [Fusarium lateritium]